MLLLVLAPRGYSQITGPVIRANFGVDADYRSNYFNGLVQAGNDDWFSFPGSVGPGQFIIDTTGAAARVARYAIDVPYRRSTFISMMRFPVFSVINNRLLLDAAFVRDFHGDDSTVFASGASKNGDSPGDWSTPVSQGVPDKNDILDVMVHIRRAGPNTTDSLWMMGGMSLDNTTGDRYFDFEMYQTDLTYNRPTLKFTGYGPDAGHTSWEFDAAGNITKAGDIIFSAEYQSSSLTNIEARIWINKASLAITPVHFAWSGLFDGAASGATFGYASIQPKGGGTYYTGLQCANNTWGGPFSIILQNDAIATDYTAKQYVEFSVNLTKLGLDPVTSITGDPCGMPFRLLVKTRASASFTAPLKDFVAPIALFIAPKADIATASPKICNQGSIAEIHVTNPLSTSVYQWTTSDGNIISSPSGPSILVDTPGTYIVTQFLQSGCFVYARDTVTILPSPSCFVLPALLTDLRGTLRDDVAQLGWGVLNNQLVKYFVVQHSTDGINFTNAGEVQQQSSQTSAASYSFQENIANSSASKMYYRILMIQEDNTIRYSHIISLSEAMTGKNKFIVFPNPAKDVIQLQILSSSNGKMKIDIYDASAKLVATHSITMQRGNNSVALNDLSDKPRGMYLIVVNTGEEVLQQKLLLVK
jgi:hypothetical protein